MKQRQFIIQTLLCILLSVCFHSRTICQDIKPISDTAYLVKYYYYTGDTFAMKYEVIIGNNALLENIWLDKYTAAHIRKRGKIAPILNFSNLKYYSIAQSFEVLKMIKENTRFNFANNHLLIPDSTIRAKSYQDIFKFQNTASDFYTEAITFRLEEFKPGLYIGVWKIAFDGYTYTNKKEQLQIFDTYHVSLLNSDTNSYIPAAYFEVDKKDPIDTYLYMFKSKLIRLKFKTKE